MVAGGLAKVERHAMNRLDKLFAAGCIDPRQDNKTILTTVAHYQKLKDAGWALDDVFAGLKASSGQVDPAALWQEAGQIAY